MSLKETDTYVRALVGEQSDISHAPQQLSCALCDTGHIFASQDDYVSHLRQVHGTSSTLTLNKDSEPSNLVSIPQKSVSKSIESRSPRRTSRKSSSKGSFDGQSANKASSLRAEASSTPSRGSTPDEDRQWPKPSSRRLREEVLSGRRQSRLRTGAAKKTPISRVHSGKGSRGLLPEDVDDRRKRQATNLQPLHHSHPGAEARPPSEPDPLGTTTPARQPSSTSTTPPQAHQGHAPPTSPQEPQRPPRQRTARPNHVGVLRTKTKRQWPDLVLQPESRQISQDQLATEVKSIYTGLTMVETKCIHIDKAQAATPKNESTITDEHWQAMIALHRTLLHEHHDFFLASQHPSASPALKRLALKYSMPARMWKHGIHSFLELLRNRLPESLEYMLAFIYLSYQMLSLLYETVDSFKTTWVECLGDLGRYRMAIEDEDIRDRDVWAGVARSWYNKAADNSPSVGRLWHHLAILARPHMLQQLHLYNHSLTSVQPFLNARESILTIFDPVLESPAKLGLSKVDLCLLKIHALLFKKVDLHSIHDLAEDYLEELRRHLTEPGGRWREAGVQTAIAIIGAIYSFGDQANRLRLASDNSRKRMQIQDPSCILPGLPDDQSLQDPRSLPQMDDPSQFAVDLASDLFLSTVRVALSRQGDKEILPFVHTLLTFVSHLYGLRTFSDDKVIIKLLDNLDWSALSVYLNTLLYSEDNIDHKFTELILFDSDSRQLPEDWLFRGLTWTFGYFPKEWFKDAAETEEEQRYMEGLTSTTKARLDRVLSLGAHVAKVGTHLHFDSTAGRFTAPGQDMDIDEGYYSVAGDDSPEMLEANKDEERIKSPFQGEASKKLGLKYSSIIADIGVFRDEKLFDAVRNLPLPVIIPEEAIAELLILEKARDVGSNEAAAALSNIRSAVHDFKSKIRIEAADGRDVTTRHIESPYAFTTQDVGLKIDQLPKQSMQRTETLGNNIAEIARRATDPALAGQRPETSFWSKVPRRSTAPASSTTVDQIDESIKSKTAEQAIHPVEAARPLLISDNRTFRAHAHNFGAAALSAWMLKKWIVQTRKHSESISKLTTNTSTATAVADTAMQIDTPAAQEPIAQL